MRQYFMPFPALVVALLGILFNFREMLDGVRPSVTAVLVTFFFMAAWLFMMLFSIKRFYTIVLFFFGMYWTLGFLTFVVGVLAELLQGYAFDFMEIPNIIFYAPLYGLRDFMESFMTEIVCGLFSFVMGLTCLLCSRRKKDAIRDKRKPPAPVVKVVKGGSQDQ